MARGDVLLIPLVVFGWMAWVGVSTILRFAGLELIRKQSWYFKSRGLVAGVVWILVVYGISLSLGLMLNVWLYGE